MNDPFNIMADIHSACAHAKHLIATNSPVYLLFSKLKTKGPPAKPILFGNYVSNKLLAEHIGTLVGHNYQIALEEIQKTIMNINNLTFNKIYHFDQNKFVKGKSRNLAQFNCQQVNEHQLYIWNPKIYLIIEIINSPQQLIRAAMHTLF